MTDDEDRNVWQIRSHVCLNIALDEAAACRWRKTLLKQPSDSNPVTRTTLQIGKQTAAISSKGEPIKEKRNEQEQPLPRAIIIRIKLSRTSSNLTYLRV